MLIWNSIDITSEHEFNEIQREIFIGLTTNQDGRDLELLFMGGKWFQRLINTLTNETIYYSDKNGEIE